jgi:surface protein
MSTINGLNQFLVPAQDGFLYQLFYNTVYGGNTGCTININGTDVQMGPKSSINILVRSVSGGTGCFLGGDRPYIYGDSQQYKYVAQTFVSVWDTTRTSAGSSTSTRVALPLISTGTYNFIVDWGDGSTDKITSWNQAQTTHTYATSGVYQMTITGTIYGFRFNNTGDRLKLLSIQKWGTAFRLGATDSHFSGCENLQLNQVEDVLDLTNTTSFANIFLNCHSLTTINNVNGWNTSNITTMASAFSQARNFNDNIGAWNTSNVTSMGSMFFITSFAGKFNNGGSSDIGNWDTSKVTDMTYMFYNQQTFNQPIGTKAVTVGSTTYTAWDVKNVTDFTFFLNITTAVGANGKFNQDISNWNTSKVTSLYITFSNQPEFNQDLSTKVVTVNGVTYTAWDTSNVTNMAFAFINSGSFAGGKFNGNISNWNTSKVTDFSSFLSNQPKFNQDLSTKVVSVSGVSYTAWDTSNVTNMSFMFWVRNAESGIFNQNISNWNTSKVTNMGSMFINQPLFNQDIGTKAVTVSGVTYSAWSVSAVTSMNQMFSGNTAGSFNNSGSTSINNWDVRKVTNMNSMFNNQTGFTQPINNWVVSGVTNFGATGLTAGFMAGKTDVNYSAENYDNLLIGWASRTVQPNQVLNMGTIKRTEASTAAKTILTSAPNNWTIVDGGLVLPFTSIWRTTASNETVTLPYLATGSTYTGIIDWGDGFISGNTYANRTHTYATAGNYTISINGMISGFCFNNTGDRLKLREITRWGTEFRPNNSSGTFFGCSNLVLTGVTDTLNLVGMTSLASFFNSCSSLTTVNRINEWNTSNITSLDSTFAYAYNFNDDIGNWNTINVTNMNSTFLAGVFNTTVGKFNQYIGNWNTSNVTTMGSMFQNQHQFNQDISTKVVTVNGVTYTAWDTLNVTNMNSIFQTSVSGFYAKFNQNIGNWNTSKVINMGRMFNDANDFNQDISTKEVTINGVTYIAWDTKEVIDMGLMFSSQTSRRGYFNQYIGNWNISKVTGMVGMLQSQPDFNQDISTKVVTIGGTTYIAWDTFNVTDITAMFNSNAASAPSGGYFNGNISNWNISKITSIQSLFSRQRNFNQDISTKVVTVGDKTYTAWDTSNVTNMSFALNGYISNGIYGVFNQNIGNWNTSKVINLASILQAQPLFNQDISTKVVTVGSNTYIAWDTKEVTNMSGLVYGSFPDSFGTFNQNIGNWNTSKVTNMSTMFTRQPLFNQDISTKVVSVSGVSYTAWSTSNVTNMNAMFYIANDAIGNFNQNINNWNTAKVTNMTDLFVNQKIFNQPINNWNVSLVTVFDGTGVPNGFMGGKTFNDYSTTNYDALLIGWASRPVLANKAINFGTIKYTSAAVAARAVLTSAPNNWTIVDGGLT